MNSILLRVVVAVLLLGATQVGYLWIEQGYTMGEIVPLKRDLTELPYRIGPWTGEDTTVDPELTGFLQARVEIDRAYRKANTNGRDDVILHSVWTEDYVRIHFPEQCYTQNGWNPVGKTEEVSFDVDGHTFSANLVTFEREGKRIQVLYWFQLGDRIFLSRTDHRRAIQQLCWGQKQWPPLAKVMLQTPVVSEEDSRNRLQTMATLMYRWINGLDFPGGTSFR